MNKTRRDILTQYLHSEIDDIINSGVEDTDGITKVLISRLEPKADIYHDIYDLMDHRLLNSINASYRQKIAALVYERQLTRNMSNLILEF